MSRNLLALNIAMTAILLAVLAITTTSYLRKEKANRLLREFGQSQNPSVGGARDELAVAQEMINWGGKIDDEHYFTHNNQVIRRLACDIDLSKDYIISAKWQDGKRQVHLMKVAMVERKIGDGQLSEMQPVVISSADIDERSLPPHLRSSKADYDTPLAQADVAKMLASLNPDDVPDSLVIGPDRVLGIWPTDPPLGDGIYIVANLTKPLYEPSTIVRTDKNKRILEMLELPCGSSDLDKMRVAIATDGRKFLLIDTNYQDGLSFISKSFEEKYHAAPVKITPGPFCPDPAFLVTSGHSYVYGSISITCIELSPKLRVSEQILFNSNESSDNQSLESRLEILLTPTKSPPK